MANYQQKNCRRMRGFSNIEDYNQAESTPTGLYYININRPKLLSLLSFHFIGLNENSCRIIKGVIILLTLTGY